MDNEILLDDTQIAKAWNDEAGWPELRVENGDVTDEHRALCRAQVAKVWRQYKRAVTGPCIFGDGTHRADEKVEHCHKQKSCFDCKTGHFLQALRAAAGMEGR